MSELVNDFTYNFEYDFTYIHNGEPVKASNLAIKAPTNRNIKETLILEQEYEKAQLKLLGTMTKALGQSAIDSMLEDRGSVPESKDNGIVTKENVIKSMLSGNADMAKCIEILKKILLSGNKSNPSALIDNIQPLNDAIFGDMDVRDTKNILGLYIINFFISSQDL